MIWMILKQKWKDQEITQFLEMKGIIYEHVSDNTVGFALGQDFSPVFSILSK